MDNCRDDDVDEALADTRALLESFDPVPTGPLSDPEALRAELVLERLVQLDAAPTRLPERVRRLPLGSFGAWPKTARVAVAASAACLLAAACAIALTATRNPASAQPALPRPLGFGHGARGEAVALLERAAVLQERASPPTGPVTYSRTRDYDLGADISRRSTTYVMTTVREVWVAPGCETAEQSWAQRTYAATGANAGAPGASGTGTGWVDTNCGMPTSSSAAQRVLLGPNAKNTSGRERSFALADGVMDHLGLGTASPAQTATLYRILESLPGLFYAGTVRDNAGRVGEAVGLPVGVVNSAPVPLPVGTPVPLGCSRAPSGVAWEYLVLDRATGRPLEVEEVDEVPPCALRLPMGPTVGDYAVVLSAGKVARLGETPR